MKLKLISPKPGIFYFKDLKNRFQGFGGSDTNRSYIVNHSMKGYISRNVFKRIVIRYHI